jgi:hypothetical protein
MNETTIRRLAFAKYLYHVSVEQSRAPEPMGAAAVLTFHDAVEFFLQVASEHVDAGAGQPSFLDYWDIIGKKLAPNVLPQKEGMRRLNKARVALKHHGTLPSRLDVESFRATVTSFLEESTPLVFGTPFAEISLSAFVSPESARAEIEKAMTVLEAGDIEGAIDSAALALELALSDYERRKSGAWGQSPFRFGESFSFSGFDLSELRRTHERTSRLVEKLVKSVENLQEAMKIVALGIDYRRYARFQLLAPYIAQTMDGKYHITRTQSAASHPPTAEDARFAIEFVIEAAIRILDFDYDVPLPAWMSETPRA